MTASALCLRACGVFCTPQEWSLYFTLSSGSLENKPYWFSKPNILGTLLPSPGTLGWGAQSGVHTPRSLGEALKL